MEKYSPTYRLEEFKASSFFVTATAAKDAFDLGFDAEGIRKVVSTMKENQFYKSMTSYADHKIWQDVFITFLLMI